MMMKIALAQILSTTSPAENLELLRTHIADAARQGADLIVFPEASMCAFGTSLSPIAEPLDGPWASAVRAAAEHHRITVVAGMFTPGADEHTVRNTLLVTGPTVDTSYDKIHLYDAFGFHESKTVTPGEHPVTFELNGITIGLATCYDVRFPDLFLQMAETGAVVNIVCASWASGPGKARQWKLATRARAMDSTTFVIAVDQADPATVRDDVPVGTPLGVGHSAVISPTGEVIKDLGTAPTMQLVGIDPSIIDQVRQALPVLNNARLR